MEETLTPAALGGEEPVATMAMTPLGKLLVVLVLVGGSFSAWKFGPGVVQTWLKPSNEVHANDRHAVPVAAAVSVRPVSSAEKPQAAQPTVPAMQSTQPASEQAKHDHLMQIAVAGRAVAEQNRERISELESAVQGLDQKLAALQTQKASALNRASREEMATAVKTVHASVAAAKEAASVDVASLPVEAVSAQSFGIAGLAKGAVSLAGGQQVSVGQALRSGETVVAVDPESHAIVTNRRIINVTN